MCCARMARSSGALLAITREDQVRYALGLRISKRLKPIVFARSEDRWRVSGLVGQRICRIGCAEAAPELGTEALKTV
jgi:hypothetical protein